MLTPALTTSTLKPAVDCCGWCLTGEAIQLLYTVPTCTECVTTDSKGRVLRLMRAVHSRKEGKR